MYQLDKLNEKELAELDGLLSSYDIFQKTYRKHPSSFIRHCIKWEDDEPAFYQLNALDRVVKNKRLAVRACRGAGKTSIIAFLAIWMALVFDNEDWKMLITANVFRLIKNQIFTEIRKWSARLDWKKIGREPFSKSELLQVSLKLTTGAVTSATATRGEMIEGFHAKYMAVVCDESKAINDEIFDSIEGTLDDNSFYLMCSTPGNASGRFYDINARKPGYENWDVMVVTIDDAIKAGRRTEQWKRDRAAQWGIGSNIYRNHVLAEFGDVGGDGLISLNAVEQSQELWKRIVETGYSFPDEDLRAIGVDVGKGGDLSTIASVYETSYEGRTVRIVKEVLKKNFDKTMQLVSFISGMFRKNIQVRIDAIGIGAGASERLSELGYNNVEPFIASERTDRTDKTNTWRLANKRTAAWMNVKEMLDDDSAIALALPDDDMVIGDLTSPKILEKAGGVLGLEGKDEIRKRLGRSTDVADAIVHSVWEIERQDMDATKGKYGIYI